MNAPLNSEHITVEQPSANPQSTRGLVFLAHIASQKQTH